MHYVMVDDLTLKEATLKLALVTQDEFDRMVDTAKMVKIVCRDGQLARKAKSSLRARKLFREDQRGRDANLNDDERGPYIVGRRSMSSSFARTSARRIF